MSKITGVCKRVLLFDIQNYFTHVNPLQHPLQHSTLQHTHLLFDCIENHLTLIRWYNLVFVPLCVCVCCSVCCSVLQYVEVYCSVYCNVCCSVLQCVDSLDLAPL